MALMECFECGGKVSTNATICPHCGQPNPAEKDDREPDDKYLKTIGVIPSDDVSSTSESDKKKKDSRQNWTILLVVIAIVIVYGVWQSTGGRSNRSNPSQSDLMTTAQIGSWDVIKKSLKVPSTAGFAHRQLLERKGSKYLFQYEVDAENSFGAKIRSTWLVIVSVKASSPDNYGWNKTFGAQKVSNPPTTEEIALMKSVNSW